jgi:hypothetical protein
MAAPGDPAPATIVQNQALFFSLPNLTVVVNFPVTGGENPVTGGRNPVTGGGSGLRPDQIAATEDRDFGVPPTVEDDGLAG